MDLFERRVVSVLWEERHRSHTSRHLPTPGTIIIIYIMICEFLNSHECNVRRYAVTNLIAIALGQRPHDRINQYRLSLQATFIIALPPLLNLSVSDYKRRFSKSTLPLIARGIFKQS